MSSPNLGLVLLRGKVLCSPKASPHCQCQNSVWSSYCWVANSKKFSMTLHITLIARPNRILTLIVRTCFGEHKTWIGGTHVHIEGALNCCGEAWACFEQTFSLLALACQKTHAKFLLVYFFSQSHFCKTKGINMEYTTIFLYFMNNSNIIPMAQHSIQIHYLKSTSLEPLVLRLSFCNSLSFSIC